MGLWSDLQARIFPRAAVRAAAAEVAVSEVRRLGRPRQRFGDTNFYDAAWGVDTARPEDAIPRRKLNQARIKRLLATNPYAAKVRATLLNNLVGYGITGTPVKGTPKKVLDAWQLWTRHADWMRELDFYGLQDLFTGTMLADGDVFIIRRFDRTLSGVVPLRIEVLDASMLDLGVGEGGIEYDDAGRADWYNFLQRRPGANGAVIFGKPVRFPAKDVIHLFRKDWPGQVRGISVFEPVLKRFEDMDDYIDAELVRKKIEACFAAFITPDAEAIGEDINLGADSGEQSYNDLDIELFEPGMIQRLRPGDKVEFGEPKPSAAIAEFARVTLLGATTGAGVPYEHGTGDLSNVNYSSYRAGNLEFQRFCGRLQWLLIIPRALERIWDWFLEDGYQTGALNRRTYAIAWTPPAFESIDRLKDVKADVEEIRAGLSSRRKLVGGRGYALDDLNDEIAEDLAASDAKGLVFEGDPRAPRAATDDTTGGNQSANQEGNPTDVED
jgi:lambda family phage portal protein